LKTRFNERFFAVLQISALLYEFRVPPSGGFCIAKSRLKAGLGTFRTQIARYFRLSVQSRLHLVLKCRRFVLLRRRGKVKRRRFTLPRHFLIHRVDFLIHRVDFLIHRVTL